MKMMQGAFFLACSNISRTRDAPTPTNISTKSEPEIVKNGTFASPATARARRGLPAPRGAGGGAQGRLAAGGRGGCGGARGADGGDARGILAAELLELRRVLEELDDPLELDLGVLDSRH